jgi:hypothetical protein
MRCTFGIVVSVVSLCGASAFAQSAGAPGPVSFQLSEARGAAGHAPVMRFAYQTAEIHQCATLESHLRVDGTTIVLGPFSLNALKGPCPPTVTPAFGAKSVSLANGRYTLRVVNADTGSYDVTVSDSLITVATTREAHGATAAYAAVLRIQANTFALTCGSPREDPKFCPGIVRALSGVAGVSAMSVPAGARGWQQQANGFWVNEPTHYFRYASDAALTEAEKLLAATMRSVPKNGGFGLAIAVSDGRDFYAPPGE